MKAKFMKIRKEDIENRKYDPYKDHWDYVEQFKKESVNE